MTHERSEGGKSSDEVCTFNKHFIDRIVREVNKLHNFGDNCNVN